jgi:3-isopropylmalate dehydratase small subunit
MEPMEIVKGKVAPLFYENIDTDQIIPAEYLKIITKKGLGRYLFYRWRYDNQDKPKRGFVLDEDQYSDATVLATGKNFGIGSSRENAVWALQDFGIKAVIAPSYGDIFYGNAVKNGLLCVRIPEDNISEIQESAKKGNLICEIDLVKQEINTNRNHKIKFNIEQYVKERFMTGSDEITLTMTNLDKIKKYESDIPKFLEVDMRSIFMQ